MLLLGLHRRLSSFCSCRFNLLNACLVHPNCLLAVAREGEPSAWPSIMSESITNFLAVELDLEEDQFLVFVAYILEQLNTISIL